jgi:hypothetical protein
MKPCNRPNSPIIALGKEVVVAWCLFMLDLIPYPRARQKSSIRTGPGMISAV